jgi:hypothetical protein
MPRYFLGHRAARRARHRHKYKIAIGHRIGQFNRRAQRGIQWIIGQVFTIEMLLIDFVGALAVAQPQNHIVTVVRHDVGQRGAKTAAA